MNFLKRKKTDFYKPPNTLSECMDKLNVLLEQEEEFKKYFNDSKSESDFVYGLHHGLGRIIRNEWGLWQDSKLKQYFDTIGIHHADDMSGIILTSFWRRKHNQEMMLGEQIKHYQEYWAQMDQNTL